MSDIQTESLPFSRDNILFVSALGMIILIGAWLRFSHLDWDAGHQLHPDERAIIFVAETISLPDSLSQAFTPSQSPLNPFREKDGSERFYSYGHVPLYATVIAAKLSSSAGTQSDGLLRTGRRLSALCDTLTVLMVGLLADQLYGRRAALLSSGLTAVAVIHIQNAHFGTVDTWLTVSATVTVLLLTRYMESSRPRDSLLAGVTIGLAVGSKVTGGLLIVPLLVSQFVQDSAEDDAPHRFKLRDQQTLWLTLLAAFVAFSITNPYALLDPEPFFKSVLSQANMVSGIYDWPFTRQYLGTAPILYYVQQMARWGLGPALTAMVYGALVWKTWRNIRSPNRAEFPAISHAWVIIIFSGIGQVKFPRYLLPGIPVLIVIASGWLADRNEDRSGSQLMTILSLLVLGITGFNGLAFYGMYDAPHPRVAATQWMFANLPADTKITAEHWDDPLPLDSDPGLREARYETLTVDPFAEPDDAAKLRTILDQYARADIIAISSKRLYGTVGHLDQRYPLTAAMYRTLFSGRLGYNLAHSFSRYPQLAGFTLYDDPFKRIGMPNPLPEHSAPGVNIGWVDESFTVYDHPLVLILRNSERLSATEMEMRILNSLP